MKIVAKINIEYDKNEMVKETQNEYHPDVSLSKINNILRRAKMIAAIGLGLSEMEAFDNYAFFYERDIENNSDNTRYILNHRTQADEPGYKVADVYIRFEIVEEE